ncbi:ABC transporter permease [Acidobacteriota bacterium]
MNFLQSVRVALSNFSRRKLRFLLTLLGIIFGVGAVIAMLAIGAGAQKEAMRVIDTMGARNVIIKARDIPDEEINKIREKSLGLSVREMETLAEAVPGIAYASGKKKVKALSVISSLGKSTSEVYGVSPTYARSTRLRIIQGRFLDEYDDFTYAQVCVLGRTARRRLFGFEPVLGHHVKVNDVWFTVIGVLEDRSLGRDEFEGVKIENVNNHIYVPIRTILKKFQSPGGESELDEIQLTVLHDTSPKEVTIMAGSLLERLHSGENDYSIVLPQALLEQHRSTQRIFNIVMGCIAGISLLVGGIGIMNIMLANVLERTGEIGLRRALGARRRDIRNQFLVESLTVSFLGGFLGIGFGYAVSGVVAAAANWNTSVTPASVLLSFFVAASVGIIFGMYPASQAASLNPVEALRYE